MSIASIVSMGYGDFGSVYLVPTLGYSSAVVVPGPFIVLSEQAYTAGSRALETYSAGTRHGQQWQGGGRSGFEFAGGGLAQEDYSAGSRSEQWEN